MAGVADRRLLPWHVGMPEREGLIARVRQMRRAEADTERREADDREAVEIKALEARLARLEEHVEALQVTVERLSSSRRPEPARQSRN